VTWDNNHFKQFASSLEATIASYGEADADHFSHQKQQVEKLHRLEREFKSAVLSSGFGVFVYDRFMCYVRDERKNILSARPFFRERQDTFKTEIAPALRERNLIGLQRFSINFMFIAFVMKLGVFGPESRVIELAGEVGLARKELIEVNIPLAISRARVFDRYRQRHLDYMDLVQIATEGLIAAVDKYVLPYGKNYGAVLYGRITGDLTEGNSETLIHFYPSDKRRIYTANKLVKQGKTFDEIAAKLNEDMPPKDVGAEVSANDIQQLHAAAVTVSGNSSGSESEDSGTGFDDEPLSRFEADPSWQPDVRYETEELHTLLKQEVQRLSLFERKLLALKGIDL
jgi:DNA-directed RNA polymerase specialized sigma subunit